MPLCPSIAPRDPLRQLRQPGVKLGLLIVLIDARVQHPIRLDGHHPLRVANRSPSFLDLGMMAKLSNSMSKRRMRSRIPASPRPI